MEIRTHSLKADSASLEVLPVVAAELQATHQTRCAEAPSLPAALVLFLLPSCAAVPGLELLCSSAAHLEAASGERMRCEPQMGAAKQSSVN